MVVRGEDTGIGSQEVQVTVDPERLADAGVSLSQVSNALRGNSATLPAGAITEAGRTFPVRTTNSYASLQEIRDLVVGFTGEAGPVRAQGELSQTAGPDSQAAPPSRPVLLSDVADVSLGSGVASSISRTTVKPRARLGDVKEPQADTVSGTSGLLQVADRPRGLGAARRPGAARAGPGRGRRARAVGPPDPRRQRPGQLR